MEGIRTLISEAEIVARVEALAAEIAQKTPDDFVIVALLKGAAVFVADLVRALYRVGARPEIEFMRLSSYGLAKVSSGEVHLLGDVPTDLAGRRVLLVDDIVDTGRSIAYAAALLHQRGIGNLLTCASRQAGAPRGQGQDRFCRLLYRRRVRGRLRHRLRGEIPLPALYRCRGGIKARPVRVMGCDSFATPAGSYTAVRFSFLLQLCEGAEDTCTTVGPPWPDLFRLSTPSRPLREPRSKTWVAGTSPATGISGCIDRITNNLFRSTGQPRREAGVHRSGARTLQDR
jgi:hypoxanthine phosphoribosyltransferase